MLTRGTFVPMRRVYPELELGIVIFSHAALGCRAQLLRCPACSKLCMAAAHSAAAAAKQTIAKVEALAEIKLHDRTGAGGDRRCQRLYFG